MNTQTATLTNGRKVAIRNLVIKGSTIVGYATWEGRFISLVNVKSVA